MTVSLGTNLDSLPDAALATVRWLVEIDHPTAGTLRYASGADADGNHIAYGSASPTPTWTPTSFTVSGINSLRSPAAAQVSVQFNSYDLTALATFLSITREASIAIYVTAALSDYTGSNDVIKLYNGKITGGYRIRPGSIEVASVASTDLFPAEHVTPANGFTNVLAEGVYEFNGGRLVIERAR